MRIRTLGIAFAVATVATVSRAAEIPETLDALNYQKLSPALAIAGKPSNEALAKLKEAGFRTAIDLRQPAEGVPSAREAVEAQGLTFVSVPVSPNTFSLDDAKKVGAILADPKAGPVLLYCSSSNRVGGVLATIDALKGKPLEEALAAGRKAGLKSPAMEKAVVRVVETKR